MRGSSKIHVSKIILFVWVAFSIVYFLYGEYSRLRVYVYNRGVRDSVVQLITEASKCQPIPVSANGKEVKLIALHCLNQPAESSETTEN